MAVTSLKDLNPMQYSEEYMSIPLSPGMVDPRVAENDFYGYSHDKGIKWNDSTDIMNSWRAERANYFNAKMWQTQNAWNKYMWDLENEYNSPEQQVQRYIDAGINPIWAISEGNPGQAQQLTSAPAQPAVMSPATYDSQQMALQYLLGNQTNATNSMLGFGNLDLGYKRLNLDTNISKSQIRKTMAETDLLRSQLTSNEFLNKINSATYDTQVSMIHRQYEQTVQEIENLKKQGELSDQQKKYLSALEDKEKAQKDQIIAATKKLESETFDKVDNLRYRWYTAQSARISANASQTSAAASMMNARTADASLNHLIEKDSKELELKSNEQILEIVDSQRGWLDRFLGTTSNVLSGVLGNDDFEMANRVVAYLHAGLKVISNRLYSNPTQANIDAFNKMQKKIQDFQNLHISLPGVIPTMQQGSSVPNPSQSWNP